MAPLIAKSKEKAAKQVRGKRGESGHKKELLAGGEVAASDELIVSGIYRMPIYRTFSYIE